MAGLMNRLSLTLKRKQKKTDSKSGPPPSGAGESWTINEELAKMQVADSPSDEQMAKFKSIMGTEKLDYVATSYHLGIAMGVFADYKDGKYTAKKLKENMASVQWVFFTENALGKSLSKLLNKLISDGIVVQEGSQDAYSVKA